MPGILRSLSVLRGLAAVAALLLTAAPALADDLAAVPESGEDRARVAFDSFAQSFMAKMQRAEANERANPKVSKSGSATYRGYGNDFDVELRPTGHPAAPYIGILRYTEMLYTCAGMATSKCSVASTVPVTEIFRYQGGRWVY